MEKLRAIICVGMSGSGKSTYAEQFCKDNPDWVEINRDNVRFTLFTNGVRDWSKYKFNKSKEDRVTEVIDQQIFDAVMEDKNIVCSDTNLNPKTRRALEDKLEGYGYSVSYKSFEITLEEAWKRDSNRQGGVGRDVLYKQWQQWLTYIGRKTYTPDPSKPKAVIVDIDGTVAQMYNRSPYEWEKVGEDKPRDFVINLVERMCTYFEVDRIDIIFLSGRDGICRPQTEEWLNDNIAYNGKLNLFMRTEGDPRKDTIVKEELFWEHVAPHYNVMGAFDDRPCMVRLWYEIGIPNVISVANPWVEF